MNKFKSVILVFALAAAAARPAHAQGMSQMDLSVGGLLVDLSNGFRGKEVSMGGVNVQVQKPVSRGSRLIGEFNAAAGPELKTYGVTFHDVSGLGGLRYAWRPAKRVSPYVQVLAGAVTSNRINDFTDVYGRRYAYDVRTNTLALEPGLGLIVMATRRVGFRAESTPQILVGDGGAEALGRFIVGGVIRFGR